MSNKNYVFWPVEMVFDGWQFDQTLHVTAKFLGNVECTPDAIYYATKHILHRKFKSSEFAWKPSIFNPSTRVLELTRYPLELADVRNALDFLRKDDYPTFRPHITIPYGLWDVIRSKGATPEELGLQLGKLKLKINGEIVEI